MSLLDDLDCFGVNNSAVEIALAIYNAFIPIVLEVVQFLRIELLEIVV